MRKHPGLTVAAVAVATAIICLTVYTFGAAILGYVAVGGFLRSFMCRAFPGARGCGYKGKGPTIHPSVRRFFGGRLG